MKQGPMIRQQSGCLPSIFYFFGILFLIFTFAVSAIDMYTLAIGSTAEHLDPRETIIARMFMFPMFGVLFSYVLMNTFRNIRVDDEGVTFGYRPFPFKSKILWEEMEYLKPYKRFPYNEAYLLYFDEKKVGKRSSKFARILLWWSKGFLVHPRHSAILISGAMENELEEIRKQARKPKLPQRSLKP